MKKYFIEYLNSKDNFRNKRIEFISYESAIQWGRDNIEKFHIDMIKIN